MPEGSPAAKPKPKPKRLPPTYTTYKVDLTTPLGIGLDHKNVVVEMDPNGAAAKSEKINVGDELSMVDGVEVRHGCRSVVEVMQANKGLAAHTFVLLREKKRGAGAAKRLTVRLNVGDNGAHLGIGVNKDNRVTDIFAGGVADLDGRIHVGDKLETIDGNDVRGGDVEDAMALGRTVHVLALVRDGKKLETVEKTAAKQATERRRAT